MAAAAPAHAAPGAPHRVRWRRPPRPGGHARGLAGGAGGDGGQFEHLLRVTEQPNATVHVVPADAGMHAGLAGPFILARTPDGGEVAHVGPALRFHPTAWTAFLHSFMITAERTIR
ncbi:Scr1 family TA system antitoxin-like transcriptional regulator [Micromonospora sp. NPDC051141]|uniref:Scr1 family TA system antitoxin-like transcriptional regulator n=1 Tax=Micromonospora sp. NPDC051141 TaxID=3364284 RepID=UPI0037B3BFFB